jgi:hypothetical protein
VARKWRDHDERALVELGKLRGQEQNVIFAAARKAMEDAERAMRAENQQGAPGDQDLAWNNESLRAEIKARFGGAELPPNQNPAESTK